MGQQCPSHKESCMSADIISLAETIFQQEGLLALIVISLILLLAGVVYILFYIVKGKDKDDDTVKTQAEVIAQLIGPIKEIAETMQAVSMSNALVSTNLLKVAELLMGHDERAELRDTTLINAVAGMKIGDEERTRRIEVIPGRVKDEIMPKLEELPQAIQEALTPKIIELKTDIGNLIQSLDDKLSARIENATDAIPSRTNELVRAELAELRDLIENRLREMVETAKNVVSEEK